MADGQVLIDSKINTAGVTKGAAEIKKEMEQTAKTAEKAAKDIEKSFENSDYKDAFNELSDSAKEAFVKIQMFRNDDTIDSKTKAAKIAGVYRELGDDQSDAMKRAWTVVKNESDSGANAVIDDLKAISAEAKNTGEKIGRTSDEFKTLFGASLSADLIVSGLKELASLSVDIGKHAVQAAADINASNAQFEQTFKGIEGTARETLNNISKEVGITATRMQNSYTKIFAFTKSVGADQEQALSISERALRAAADSAAYYDVSMEEATETLQSFLKGNYENDAALGIAATETTRNAKANELYAKSFKDLSEAQKVDVLLAMVEAGNEASGALGQAAREADSWTNVTGELQEAWRQFLAVLGTPALGALIPIIQGITDSLQALIDKTASEELADGLNNFEESIGRIDSQFEKNSQTIEKNAVLADYYKQRLEELEREGFEPASAASREYAHAVEELNAIYPELNLQIDEHTGLVTADTKANFDNLDSMKERALIAAQEAMITEAVKAHAAAKADLILAEQELFSVQDQRKILQEQIGYSDEQMAWAMEHRILAASDLTYAEVKLLEQAIALNKEEQALQKTYEEGQAAVAEYETQINQISESVQAWQEKHSESVANVTEATQEAVAQTGDAVAEQNKETLSQIESNTAETVNTIAQDAADAANAFESDFSTPTQENAEATGEVLSESLSNAAETMEESWGDKGQWFESNVASPIKTSTESIGSTMLSTNSSMESETAAAWNRMVQTVQNAINRMQSSINSLTGKTVNISVNKTGSGASMINATGYDGLAYTPDAVSAVPMGIPMLATGAVIPPNAPFFAILGDQKHGTNIEAPLETIKQAVAEVNIDRPIDIHIHFDGDLAQLGRILQPVIEEETRRIGPSLSESFIYG